MLIREKFVKLLVALGGILLLVVIFVFAQRLLKIKRITCFSQYGDCGSSILDNLAVVKGENLFSAKTNSSRVLSRVSSISKFSTRFSIPNTLEVHIILRKPVAAVKTKTSKFFLVSQDGTVIGVSSSTNLPTLEGSLVNPKLGDKLSSQEIFAMKILSGVFYLYQIKRGVVEGSLMTVVFPEGLGVVFPLVGDKDVLLGSLRLIASRLNKTKEDFKIDKISVLDLRFKNPIIR